MSDGIWSALSGAVGQLAALDVAANNVANAATPGFRAERVAFQEHLGRARAPRGRPGTGMRFSVLSNVSADTSQGAIAHTGRPLDVAIRGDGYFVVSTPRGERYSRLGSFNVARNGQLVTRDGDIVLGEGRRPIRVPVGGAEVHIAPDGTVASGGAVMGRILMAGFPRNANLEKEGSALLRPGRGAGSATVMPALLEPGSLEQSNLSAVKGMIEIVGATRSFEACERMIDAFRDADRRAAMNLATRA